MKLKCSQVFADKEVIGLEFAVESIKSEIHIVTSRVSMNTVIEDT